MCENGIFIDVFESGKCKVFIVDDDEEFVELLVDVFDCDGCFDICCVNNGFDVGMLVKEF